MATAKTTNDQDILYKIRQEGVDHLDKMAEGLAETEKDLDALEKIGYDVTKLRERVDWAKTARDIILDRFHKK
jgi:hypothetical protein